MFLECTRRGPRWAAGPPGSPWPQPSTGAGEAALGRGGQEGAPRLSTWAATPDRLPPGSCLFKATARGRVPVDPSGGRDTGPTPQSRGAQATVHGRRGARRSGVRPELGEGAASRLPGGPGDPGEAPGAVPPLDRSRRAARPGPGFVAGGPGCCARSTLEPGSALQGHRGSDTGVRGSQAARRYLQGPRPREGKWWSPPRRDVHPSAWSGEPPGLCWAPWDSRPPQA